MNYMNEEANLYKWNKHDSKLKSKMKDASSIQHIHAWLRKVEEASDNAITNVFKDNTETAPKKPISNQKSNKYLSTNQLNTHTDAYSEAYDLLNQWVTDKIRLDIDDDLYNYVNVGEVHTFNNKHDSILDKYINDNSNATNDLLHISGLDYDKYDETYIAKDIVNEMLKKKFVDPKRLLNEDKKSKVVDIRSKIEMRHQLVKENRDKRAKENEERRKEKLAKKEAEIQAKQMVMKEEQEKKMQMNIEQQLLEQEVERLRKEMAEQRKKDETYRLRQREIEMSIIEKEKQEQVRQQKLIELNNIEKAIGEKRKELEEKRAEELLQSYLKAKNMRLAQRILTAWYGMILESRLKSGKAKALYDWKISYKLFNAWKKVSLSQKVRKEQVLYENHMKEENMKIVRATNFYNIRLLARCMGTWKDYTRSEKNNKRLEEDKLKTKSKMQMFLEAAAQGKLAKEIESNQVDNTLTNNQNSSSRLNTSKQSSNVSKTERNTKKTIKIMKRPKSASSSNRDISIRTQSNKDRTTEEYDQSDLAIDIPDTERDEKLDRQIRKMMWPYVKTPFMVNNFENRYKAHEKLLHEQQKMIKEQQRIIEELKFQQSQVAFKEQIALLEQIRSKQDELERMQKIQYNQERKLIQQEALARKEKNKQERKLLIENLENALNNTNNNNNNNTAVEDNTDNFEDEADNTTLNQVDQTQNQTVNETNRDTSSANNSKLTTTPKVPVFLKNMEERAKQRDQTRKEREEKRKKQEIEKLLTLQKQQEEKLKQEEEERRKKNEELKEKRRQERELKEKRDIEKKHEELMQAKADIYYKKYLCQHYCMGGFKKLVQIRRNNMSIAIQHYQQTVARKALFVWKHEIDLVVDRKNAIADRFYRKYLLKLCFKNGWKKFKISIQLEEAKANRFYKYNLKLKLFNNWRMYKNNEKLKYIKYNSLLNDYCKNKLIKRYFHIWRMFPSEQRRLREREKRLNEMRSKVQRLLPDYELHNSTNSSIH